MIPYVALLRGINVSGQKSMPMKDLKALCEELGFQAVRTYLQSGNVLFTSMSRDTASMRGALEAAILERFGFDVPALVLPRAGLANVVSENPFASAGGDGANLYVAFLYSSPLAELLEALALPPGEECHIAGTIAYLRLPAGYGVSKLNNNFLERKLKVIATTRNWKTVKALATG